MQPFDEDLKYSFLNNSHNGKYTNISPGKVCIGGIVSPIALMILSVTICCF